MSKIEELFIPYELAVIAKEKGFNEGCIAVYWYGKLKSVAQSVKDSLFDVVDNKELLSSVSAPLYQQLISWFKGFRIMICEYPSFGWVIYVDEKEDGIYLQKYANMSLDKAIEEAFKLI